MFLELSEVVLGGLTSPLQPNSLPDWVRQAAVSNAHSGYFFSELVHGIPAIAKALQIWMGGL